MIVVRTLKLYSKPPTLNTGYVFSAIVNSDTLRYLIVTVHDGSPSERTVHRSTRTAGARGFRKLQAPMEKQFCASAMVEGGFEGGLESGNVEAEAKPPRRCETRGDAPSELGRSPADS